MTHSLLLRRILHVAVFALPLLCGVSTAVAQNATRSALDGRWAGVLDTVHPDGSVDPDEVYLSIGEAASAAGGKPDHLSPASAVTRSGSGVVLTVPVNAGMTVRFDMSATQKEDRTAAARS